MTKTQCPQCKWVLTIDSIEHRTVQCHRCWTMLSWDGQQLTLVMARCPSCGERVSSDALSCSSCQAILSLDD